MIVLGLGCNLGDRLQQLRRALDFLRKLPGLIVKQVSPLYISDALLPEDAPDSWNKPYLNLAVRCETTLQPEELLAQVKHIEKLVGRTPEKTWGPRIIDIDLLAWDNLILSDKKKLHLPHHCLHERPFALWPLADIAPRWIYPLPGPFHGKTATEITAQWPSRFDGSAPFRTRQIAHRIDTPALVGIINATTDSFSADGILHRMHSHEFANQLVQHGAEILDIGAEATGPKATPITSTEEWQRLEPILLDVLQTRNNFLITPKISVDTRHADVAEKALALGVDWINDVSGLDDPDMIALLKHQTCDIVFMHHMGIPAATQTIPNHEDPVLHVYEWAEKKIALFTQQGIAAERLILDVGIGFGKTAVQSLELIQRINKFKSLGIRLLVGHSRKSFLTLFTSKPAFERDIETVMISHFLAQQSVDFLRVHDIEAHSRCLKVSTSLKH